MNFQWILLALLAAALLFGTVMAGKRSMQKNALRLLCVPVAFIITFILQACGCMRWLADLLIEALELASAITGFEGAMDFILAYLSTLLTPVAFLVVFFVLLWLFRILHVNLICSYLDKRRVRREKKQLKAAIDSEKERVKTALKESEERAEEIAEEYAETGELPEENIQDLIYAPYRKLDKDDIEDLAEERVKLEKKKLKKTGFFKESRENKTISLVCGAVSAFLVFGIMLMPLFYTMTYLEAAVDGIRNTDSEDSKIYKVVSVVDETVVTPFEDSFVNQLYDSLALKDLMNYTVRLGGRMNVGGREVYADDVVKGIITHSVRAASELMSGRSEREHIKEDLDVIISDPVVVSTLTTVVTNLLNGVENPKPTEETDIVSTLKYEFLDHYKTADREVIEGDIRALSSVADALVSSGLVDSVISGGETDMSAILADGEKLGDLLGAASELSVYGEVIPPLFTSMSEMLGSALGVPADDAEAYDVFIQNIIECMADTDTVSNIDTDEFDMARVISFVAFAESSGKSVQECITDGAIGSADFLAYCAHWVSVQNAFMHASEDMSLGYPIVSVGDKAYLYDMSADEPEIVLLTDANAELYSEQTSPVYELIGYLVTVSKQTPYSEEGIKTLLAGYTAIATRETDKALAQSLLDRTTFVSKSVTIEKLKAANDFEDWTAEERKQDSKELAAIVTDLASILSELSDSTAESGETDVGALLDSFVVLGRAMDAMGRTSCMKDLPPLILNALVMNEQFGDIMNPLIVDSINDTVQNSGKTYEQVMTGLVSLFKALLA